VSPFTTRRLHGSLPRHSEFLVNATQAEGRRFVAIDRQMGSGPHRPDVADGSTELKRQDALGHRDAVPWAIGAGRLHRCNLESLRRRALAKKHSARREQ
jgi:hypothetical protein